MFVMERKREEEGEGEGGETEVVYDCPVLLTPRECVCSELPVCVLCVCAGT